MLQPAPQEDADVSIDYVNPAQYHRICQRRSEKALRETVRPTAPRQKYLHESRHKHALNRTRGNKGRFSNAGEMNKQNEDGEFGMGIGPPSLSVDPPISHQRTNHVAIQPVQGCGSVHVDVPNPCSQLDAAVPQALTAPLHMHKTSEACAGQRICHTLALGASPQASFHDQTMVASLQHSELEGLLDFLDEVH